MTKIVTRSEACDRLGRVNAMIARLKTKANVKDLEARWWLVVETRVVESDDPVAHRWVNGKLEAAK